MRNGAWGAQVSAIGAQTLWSVHTLGAGHPPQANHLQPLRQPWHQVSKQLARFGEIKTDDRIALIEVGMGRGQQHQGSDSRALARRQVKRNRSAVGVPQDHWPVEAKLDKNPFNVLRCGSQAGIDIRTPLGLTSAGKIERDNVQIRTKVVYQREERLRAAHQAMQEDKRRLIPGRATPFKIGEAKTVYANLATHHHRLSTQSKLNSNPRP